MHHDLSLRWRADVGRVATGDSGAIDDAGHRLLQRWGEPHRRYHGLQHLHEVLVAIDATGSHLDAHELAIARLAGWFHDAVYDVAHPQDNEPGSALVARKVLGKLGVASDIIDDVEILIRASADHTMDLRDRPGTVFHDADLWVLSAPARRFDEYCAQVREEYAAIPGAVYARVRGGILSGFLQRPFIYLTEVGRAWEASAVGNVRRELARLAV